MRLLTASLIVAVFGFGFTTAQQRAGTEQPDPCKSKHRLAADITYCDRYWECVAGQPQLFDCPNGLAFVGRNRGISEGCDYPWRGSYCDQKQQANPPISTEHCDWLYGIFGHETSCTRYWTCWNGTATEQFCIGGLLYSEEDHSCAWPQDVPGCQKHPLCKDDPNANVPLGTSCERYWSCQGGYPRLQRCPANLVFDKQSRRCVPHPTVDCDLPTTTILPPKEVDNSIAQRAPPARSRRPISNQQQDFIDERPSQQLRNQGPRPAPFIPANSQPINFNGGGNQQFSRPSPIDGATPLN